MALLQILAASVAGVARLAFHAGDEAGCRSVSEAQARVGEIFSAASEVSTAEVLERVDRMGFAWGMSDGN
jgi:hypothetical protein